MADLDDIRDGKDFGLDKPQTNKAFYMKGLGALDWGMQSRLANILIRKPVKPLCWRLITAISKGRPPDWNGLI